MLLGSTPRQHVCVKKVSTKANSSGSYAKPDEVAGEYSLAACLCHETFSLQTDEVAGEYSLAARPCHDAVNIQTMFS